jgi:FdrA protein
LIIKVFVKKNEYYDSVRLMAISSKIKELTDVIDAAVFVATPSNKKLVVSMGFTQHELMKATSNDTVVAIKAKNENGAEIALAKAKESLSTGFGFDSGLRGIRTVPSISMASQVMPSANFVLISIPGEYAAVEAERALKSGYDVMIFSDNVSLEEEVRFKQLADSKGKWLMGPDCGTAIINGIPLGFANFVRKGKVGLVGAAGTGLQEVSVLIDRAGYGVSQAIGTGGRDLYDAVQGWCTRQGLKALDYDPDTEVIVLVAKSCGTKTKKVLMEDLQGLHKPVIVCVLDTTMDLRPGHNIFPVLTLDEAARMSANLLNHAATKRDPKRRFIRGIYSGGSLAAEAVIILEQHLGSVGSNLSSNRKGVSDPWVLSGHFIVDTGDDFFTRGRPHPMIDHSVREIFFESQSKDPEVAVILFDVVLGTGAHANPASVLAHTVEKARANSSEIIFIASICGTQHDQQELEQQRQRLENTGVIVADSNAAAVWKAVRILATPLLSEEVELHIDERERFSLFKKKIEIINVGLSDFATELHKTTSPVIHVDWKPPQQLDKETKRLLDRVR